MRDELVKKQSKIKNGFSNYFSNNKKLLLESSSALIFTIVTATLAGLFLGQYRETLLLIPGLIILIPGTISMRGTILGTMGSRIGSSYHLGLIKKFTFKNKIIKDNSYAAFILSIYLSLILAFYAFLLSRFLGLTTITLWSLIAISFLGTIISVAILLVLIFSITFRAYQRGVDIDNVNAPMVASLGDLVTIPALLFAAAIVLKIAKYAEMISYVVIAIILGSLVFVFFKKVDYKSIIMQSVLVLSFSAILSSTGGLLLQHNLETLAALPSILVLVPAFIGTGGNIGSIFASRLTTEINLGLIKTELKSQKKLNDEFKHALFFSIFIFPLVGLSTYYFSKASGLATISIFQTIAVSWIAGLMLVGVVTIVAFLTSLLSTKVAADPDNVLIPLVASTADFLGIFCMIIVLILFGIL